MYVFSGKYLNGSFGTWGECSILTSLKDRMPHFLEFNKMFIRSYILSNIYPILLFVLSILSLIIKNKYFNKTKDNELSLLIVFSLSISLSHLLTAYTTILTPFELTSEPFLRLNFPLFFYHSLFFGSFLLLGKLYFSTETTHKKNVLIPLMILFACLYPPSMSLYLEHIKENNQKRLNLYSLEEKIIISKDQILREVFRQAS